METSKINMSNLYKKRFKNRNKEGIWKILCKYFFQKFIKEDSIIIDIAAGYCEFINNIHAKNKVAVDVNPDIRNYAGEDVTVINDSVFNIFNHFKSDCDIIFASNFFEHLNSREDVISVMEICHKLLSVGGKLLILQPNIKYTKETYWDFIDHKIPITDKSLIEAGELCGFKTIKNIPRFLPYTTKSSVPQNNIFVLLYLKFPPIWYFMGKQSFLVLEK